MKYIVASPGRSGSIFVALTISQSLKIPLIVSNQQALPQTAWPFVYHTHDAQLQLDSQIPVLHVVRQDTFAQIISAVICEQYNEWSVYSGNKQPFMADLEVFENKYWWHKYWHQAHQSLTHYNNRQTLIFEQFIGRSEFVCDQLQIPRVKVNTNKNPYCFENIVNIDELQAKFVELEQQPAPDVWLAQQWKDVRAQ